MMGGQIVSAAVEPDFDPLSCSRYEQCAARFNQPSLKLILDTLGGEVLALDESGVIQHLNSKWTASPVARHRFDAGCAVGRNYLEICAQSQVSPVEARLVAEGVRAVRDGNMAQFRHLYLAEEQLGAGAGSVFVAPFRFLDKRLLIVWHACAEKIRPSQGQANHWSIALLRAQGEERQRIARDLHDSTAQNLLQIELGLMRLKKTSLPQDDELYASLQGAIEQIYQEIRTLSYLLDPPGLTENGLVGALAELASGFARRTGIEVHFQRPRPGIVNPLEVKIALFRLAQEALANVLKHSGATRIAMRLAYLPQHVALCIRDNGSAFNEAIWSPAGPAAKNGGSGLRNMFERTRALGGKLSFRNFPGGGASLSAILPRTPPAVRPAPLDGPFDWSSAPVDQGSTILLRTA